MCGWSQRLLYSGAESCPFSLQSFARDVWPSPVGNVAPLVFVLLVSAVKEGIEDFFRHRADKKENMLPVQVWGCYCCHE